MINSNPYLPSFSRRDTLMAIINRARCCVGIVPGGIYKDPTHFVALGSLFVAQILTLGSMMYRIDKVWQVLTELFGLSTLNELWIISFTPPVWFVVLAIRSFEPVEVDVKSFKTTIFPVFINFSWTIRSVLS